ncbi:response regulator [Deinococcus humi]|uniref:CheY-like chemotaxis protein n=1 Tax=Deinococcus humi TaxID=662880 RepID=A0A7W8JY23_9DEIO|nr:response regulator [Deinococcus humi]MBB5365330.1 CheY-like chemotaxis protein [Deinococcus humi]
MTLPRHYLLVDDNPHDHFLTQAAFEQLCPECVVTCVGSGMEALELLQTQMFQPDVVLLDLNMPGMNGFEVLQAMKANARLVRIPVVILSTSDAERDVEQAYTLHASSYLVKSESFSEFLEQLETVVKYWQTSRTVVESR